MDEHMERAEFEINNSTGGKFDVPVKKMTRTRRRETIMTMLRLTQRIESLLNDVEPDMRTVRSLGQMIARHAERLLADRP